uniref:Uncharacterized protein n=1 Tax=Thermosporothrix sp. COM3 TaxID=2490863 RepID=A0A455SSP5_9CHLR|nr:hypothetical protein KTC_48500 [Thermosporothrix sp. COM3]BBH90164.1 hypothetical protein KTC_49150 [Thermosporothrix sp. COM3]BBH90229.1 hypothetical protein KTC_49800 [Thermosporothrix sp. COM3]
MTFQRRTKKKRGEMAAQNYIPLEEVANQLQVTRATVYYYIKVLKLEKRRFPLDRRAYLAAQDVERIKKLKEDAARRSSN